MPSDAKSEFEQFGQELVAATAAVAGGPLLGAAGLVAAGRALDEYHKRRAAQGSARMSFVIAQAAAIAEEEAQAFLAALGEDEAKQELLVRTVRTAAESDSVPKLFAAANALARGRLADTPLTVAIESAFMRALADLETGHIQLLRKLVSSPAELGLGPSQEPVETLNRVQIERVAGEAAVVLDPMLSVLQGHGLVRPFEARGGLTSGAALTGAWQITSIGVEFLDRLELVGQIPQ